MSKAVLVIDMPNSCDECPLFCNYYSDMYCEGSYDRAIDYPYPENFRQEWCPLIELPKKKQEKYSPFGSYDTYEEKVDSVALGYNQCLDDICKNDKYINGKDKINE